MFSLSLSLQNTEKEIFIKEKSSMKEKNKWQMEATLSHATAGQPPESGFSHFSFGIEYPSLPVHLENTCLLGITSSGKLFLAPSLEMALSSLDPHSSSHKHVKGFPFPPSVCWGWVVGRDFRDDIYILRVGHQLQQRLFPSELNFISTANLFLKEQEIKQMGFGT